MRFWTAALVVAALALPASSQASQTIGQTGTPLPPPCFGATYRQATLTGGASYVTPARGVVTSWRTLAGSAPVQTLQFVTIHPDPATPGSFIYDGVDIERSISPGALNTFSVRLPIAAGGEIGIHLPLNSQASCVFSAAAGDNYGLGAGAANPGSSQPFSSGSSDMARVDVSATVEADADGDGFGDESQDKCVGTPGSFNGCPSTFSVGKARAKGSKVKVTATVPGAGTLKAGSSNDARVASASKAKSLLKPVTRNLTSTSQQSVSLTVKLSKAGKKKLAAKGKLKLKIKVVYTPAGGPPSSQTVKVKLKG